MTLSVPVWEWAAMFSLLATRESMGAEVEGGISEGTKRNLFSQR